MKTPYIFRGIQLPEHLRESLDAYAQTGRPTGDFLRYCIENNLCKAVAFADEVSLPAIPAIVGYLYNEMPSKCWGTKDSFNDWIQEMHEQRAAESCERTGAEK